MQVMFLHKNFYTPSTSKVEILKVGNIEVKTEFKKIRHMYLRINRKGNVMASVPYKTNKKKISNFINSKQNWIECQQKKILQFPNPPPQNYNYCNGSKIDFLGKELELIVESIHTHTSVCLEQEKSQLLIKTTDTSHHTIEKKLEKWQRKELLKHLLPLIYKWENIMGVQAQEYRIRKMYTRWGTCNPAAKRIWISLELLKKPLICLEYILVHEMSHLLERGHTHKFYRLMNHYLPKWKDYQKILNGTTK